MPNVATPSALVNAVPVSLENVASSSLLSEKVSRRSACGSPNEFVTVAIATNELLEERLLSASPLSFCSVNATLMDVGSVPLTAVAEKVVVPVSPLPSAAVISPSPDAVLAFRRSLATPLELVRAVPVSLPNSANASLLSVNVNNASLYGLPSSSVTVATANKLLSSDKLLSLAPLSFSSDKEIE